MLPLDLFRNRTYTGANTVVLLVALAMFGVFFFVSLDMQNILGFSAIMANEAAGRTSPEAFMDGFRGSLLVAAGIALAGAFVSFVLVRPHERDVGSSAEARELAA